MESVFSGFYWLNVLGDNSKWPELREFLIHEEFAGEGTGEGSPSGVARFGAKWPRIGPWFLFTSQLFRHVPAAVPGSAWRQALAASPALLVQIQSELESIIFIAKKSIFVSAPEVTSRSWSLCLCVTSRSWRGGQRHFLQSKSKVFLPQNGVQILGA